MDPGLNSLLQDFLKTPDTQWDKMHVTKSKGGYKLEKPGMLSRDQTADNIAEIADVLLTSPSITENHVKLCEHLNKFLDKKTQKASKNTKMEQASNKLVEASQKVSSFKILGLQTRMVQLIIAIHDMPPQKDAPKRIACIEKLKQDLTTLKEDISQIDKSRRIELAKGFDEIVKELSFKSTCDGKYDTAMEPTVLILLNLASESGLMEWTAIKDVVAPEQSENSKLAEGVASEIIRAENPDYIKDVISRSLQKFSTKEEKVKFLDFMAVQLENSMQWDTLKYTHAGKLNKETPQEILSNEAFRQKRLNQIPEKRAKMKEWIESSKREVQEPQQKAPPVPPKPKVTPPPSQSIPTLDLTPLQSSPSSISSDALRILQLRNQGVKPENSRDLDFDPHNIDNACRILNIDKGTVTPDLLRQVYRKVMLLHPDRVVQLYPNKSPQEQDAIRQLMDKTFQAASDAHQIVQESLTRRGIK